MTAPKRAEGGRSDHGHARRSSRFQHLMSYHVQDILLVTSL
jgi:hypothetical protein